MPPCTCPYRRSTLGFASVHIYNGKTVSDLTVVSEHRFESFQASFPQVTCACHHFRLCKNMCITTFFALNPHVWMKALGAGTVFDDSSKFSSVSLHDSPKVLSGLLSIKLGLIETIRIIHSTLYRRKRDLFLLLSSAFIFWQALGTCYRFPKCISLHFCNLRWPLRYFAPRLYIHSHPV